MFQNATILNGDCKIEILIFIADNGKCKSRIPKGMAFTQC